MWCLGDQMVIFAWEKLPVDWGRISKSSSNAQQTFLTSHLQHDFLPYASAILICPELSGAQKSVLLYWKHHVSTPFLCHLKQFMDKHLTQKSPFKFDRFVISVKKNAIPPCFFSCFPDWHEQIYGPFSNVWPYFSIHFFLKNVETLTTVVGGWTNPLEKYMIVKLGINSPRWNGMKIPKNVWVATT